MFLRTLNLNPISYFSSFVNKRENPNVMLFVPGGPTITTGDHRRERERKVLLSLLGFAVRGVGHRKTRPDKKQKQHIQNRHS